MSFNEDQSLECPLCMEPLEMDDINFFPCTCGYQICRFCWHRIRTDENGLCPACRKQYPEDPADFKPLSPEELQRIKNEKRQKDLQRKQKLTENRKHLANVRVVQKNLVFVVGLPSRLADAETLKRHDYFGKFGKIHKVVVNQSTSYAGSQGPSASAYVTYYKPEDALRAIEAVNNIHVDGRILKASLGTTKYCSHFLKNQQCPKSDCMYLHELGDEAASFTKEEMQQGKHQEYERKLHEQIIGSNHKKLSSLNTSNVKVSSKDIWPLDTSKDKVNSRQNGLTKGSSVEPHKNSKQSGGKSSTTEIQKSKKSKSGDRKAQKKNSSVNKVQIIKEESSRESVQQSESESSNRQKSLQRLKAQLLNNSVNSALSKSNQDSLVNNSLISQESVQCDNDQIQPVVMANIQIESETSSSPPSPSSSSSSSLFTPFGSFSSSFPSSSPSPPLGLGSPQSPDSLRTLSEVQHCANSNNAGNANVCTPSVNTFADTRSKSYNPLNGLGTYGNSLFSSSTDFTGKGIISSDEWLKNPDGTSISKPETIPVNSSTDWQAAFGFGHCHKSQDDDLGFDPWDESSKGLADLLEKEAVHNSNIKSSYPPGFNNHSLYNSPSTQLHYRIPQPPPPGFSTSQTKNNLNAQNFPFNTDATLKLSGNVIPRNPVMNGLSHSIMSRNSESHNLSNYLNSISSQNFQDMRPRVNDILHMKEWKENLHSLPNNINFGPTTMQQQQPPSHSHKAPTWNGSLRDISWIMQDHALLSSRNITENHPDSSSSHLLKSLQQLTLEHGQNGFNHYHHQQQLPYGQSFPYRDL